MALHNTNGTGAPVTTPTKLGQHYTDTSNGDAYLSIGTSSAADWQIVGTGNGDALTTNPLSQFAATTSAELRGVLSDETGTGSAVFATSPTLVTPALGTPSALVLTNATGLPLTTGVTGVLPVANFSTGTPTGSKFVRDDGVLAVPPGTGTVTTTGSPASGNLAKFSGASSIVNGDLTGDVTTSGTLATTLASTAVTPGSYTLTNLTVDAKGRITAASSGSATGTIGGSTGATDNAIVRADGTGGATLQSSGVTIDDSNNVGGVVALSATTIELGHASDTTLARSSAGNVSVEGNLIYRAGGTDVPVTDGGTGVSSLTAYAVVCGGTTSTAAVQSIASVGSSGHVLTSNGAGALPTFQAASGGSGDSTTTAAYASRPAASNDGNLFLPSDSFQIERDTGSVWAPWGPIFPMTPPVDGDFAWVNQGGASVTTSKGGIHLLGPAGAGTNFRIRIKTAPATPYTITACFLPRLPALDFASCGLIFRQSSDGKLATLGIGHSSDWEFSFNKYSSATAFAAQYNILRMKMMFCPAFIRIADNGTSRILSFSTDGQNFQQLHSVGRTDYLTADQVGFFVNAEQATWDVAATLLSWKEA